MKTGFCMNDAGCRMMDAGIQDDGCVDVGWN
jgi:hypothetical protein